METIILAVVMIIIGAVVILFIIRYFTNPLNTIKLTLIEFLNILIMKVKLPLKHLR